MSRDRRIYQIYFARALYRCSSDDLIKIGCTQYSLRDRMESLRSPRGRQMVILYGFPTFDKEDERVIQWMLRAKRVRGEWFDINGVDMDDVITKWLSGPGRCRRQYRRARLNGYRFVHLKKRSA